MMCGTGVSGGETWRNKVLKFKLKKKSLFMFEKNTAHLKSLEWVTGICVCSMKMRTPKQLEGKDIKDHFQSYLFIICLHVSYTFWLSASFMTCPFLKSYIHLHNWRDFSGAWGNLLLMSKKCSTPLSISVMVIVHTFSKLFLWGLAGLLLVPSNSWHDSQSC